MEGGVNQQGVDFYNNLINELISNGMDLVTLNRLITNLILFWQYLNFKILVYLYVDITPFVTILHFDYPLNLFRNGGFLNPDIV